MPRRITDSRGVRWDVWEVDRKDLGRFTYDRRGADRADAVDAPPTSLTSQANPLEESFLESMMVHPELRDGWLCFQSSTDRRRLAPIPVGWHEASDDALRDLLDAATPVTRGAGAARPAVDS